MSTVPGGEDTTLQLDRGVLAACPSAGKVGAVWDPRYQNQAAGPSPHGRGANIQGKTSERQKQGMWQMIQ